MDIYYLNDEPHPITVKILDANGDNHSTLQPAEGKLFNVAIPNACILFVKKWPNMVMFSYVAPGNLPQST